MLFSIYLEKMTNCGLQMWFLVFWKFSCLFFLRMIQNECSHPLLFLSLTRISCQILELVFLQSKIKERLGGGGVRY